MHFGITIDQTILIPNVMKNRFIRVTVVTLIVYVVYTFFFIDDIIDVPVNKKNSSIESRSYEKNKDSISLESDSVPKIKNK